MAEEDNKEVELIDSQFSADRPIENPENDLLNRSSFAEELAKRLRQWKERDSLVIALQGEWGSGKTSLKNMTIHNLRKDESTCPVIREFNPWQWSAQDKLLEVFFETIGSAIIEVDSLNERKKRWKLLKQTSEKRKRSRAFRVYLDSLKISAVSKIGSTLVDGFRNLISFMILVIVVSGNENSFIENQAIRYVLGFFALVSLGLRDLFGFFEKLSGAAASLFSINAMQSGSDLGKNKEELEKHMRKLRKPILMVIDDIDRLSPDEIKTLFQLVKTNADFPNLIYLLLFHREYVEKSLEKVGIVSGGDYLEKIVQVSFGVPEIEMARLEKVLLDGLDSLFSDSVVARHFDSTRWGNLYVAGIRPYFSSMRDVYRFLNTLDFHVGNFNRDNVFEVNLMDLIGVEVLRMFVPNVYSEIYKNKDLFTSLSDNSRESDAQRKNKEERLTRIIENAPSDGRVENLKEILDQLFPSIGYLLSGYVQVGGAEKWLRELRICHPDMFDRYLINEIPEGDVSQSDIEQIISLAGNREALVSQFMSLKERGLLDAAMDRLDSYKETIDIKHALPFITAILDVGNSLSSRRGGFFHISSTMSASRIILWYLRQEKDIEKRGEILIEAFKFSHGFSLLIYKVSLEDQAHEKKEDEREWLVNEEDLKELRGICLDLIRRVADSGNLIHNSDLLNVLYRWRDWASIEEPKGWVEQSIQHEEYLLAFLRNSVSTSRTQSIGDHVSKEQKFIKYSDLENFVSMEILESKVKALKINELNDEDKLAVEAFIDAVNRKESGRSDDWASRDDDDIVDAEFIE